MHYSHENQNYEINKKQNRTRRKSGPTKGSRRLSSTYEEKLRNSDLEPESRMPVFPNFPQVPRTKKPHNQKLKKEKLKANTLHIYRSQEYPQRFISNIADLVARSWSRNQ